MVLRLAYQKLLRLRLNDRLRSGRLNGIAEIFGRIEDRRKLRFKWEIIDAVVDVGAESGVAEIEQVTRAMPERHDRLYAPILALLCGDVDGARALAWRQIHETRADAELAAIAKSICFFVHGRILREHDLASAPLARDERAHFQYWDKDTPEDVAADMRRWRAACAPLAAHETFDDRSARAFIAERFGSEHAHLYDLCSHPAMKCDFFRLCRMYDVGGSYSDADTRPEPHAAAAIASLRSCDSFWIHGDYRFIVTNWFLSGPRGSRLYERFIEEACRRISDPATRAKSVPTVAGPSMMDDVLHRDLSEVVSMEYAVYLTRFGRRRLMRVTQPKYKKSGKSWQVFERDKTQSAPLKF